MNLPVFKIRASQVGSIMGKLSGGITEKQAEDLKKLQAKPAEGKGSPTVKQKETLQELLTKKDTVKGLPKGCKTYLKGWVKEQIYGRRKEIKSKYTDKGNICEDEAIDMLMTHYNLTYNEKNEVHYENDYLTGTPDLPYPDDIVFDTKCSYEVSTFPLFETEYSKDYWWQLQAYMELLDIPKAGLVYALVNTPHHIVDQEIRSKTYGMVDDTAIEDMANKIRAYHNYDSIGMEYRLKRYDFQRDEQAMEAVNNRVIMCRNYIKELVA